MTPLLSAMREAWAAATAVPGITPDPTEHDALFGRFAREVLAPMHPGTDPAACETPARAYSPRMIALVLFLLDEVSASAASEESVRNAVEAARVVVSNALDDDLGGDARRALEAVDDALARCLDEVEVSNGALALLEGRADAVRQHAAAAGEIAGADEALRRAGSYQTHMRATLAQRVDHMGRRLAESEAMTAELAGWISALRASFVGVTDDADDPTRLHTWQWLAEHRPDPTEDDARAALDRFEAAEIRAFQAGEALAEYRRTWPCPRGCGSIGQCVDASGALAVCPVCDGRAPTLVVDPTVPGTVPVEFEAEWSSLRAVAEGLEAHASRADLPALRRTMLAGIRAGARGALRRSCPFTIDLCRAAWLGGWLDGQTIELDSDEIATMHPLFGEAAAEADAEIERVRTDRERWRSNLMRVADQARSLLHALHGPNTSPILTSEAWIGQVTHFAVGLRMALDAAGLPVAPTTTGGAASVTPVCPPQAAEGNAERTTPPRSFAEIHAACVALVTALDAPEPDAYAWTERLGERMTALRGALAGVEAQPCNTCDGDRMINTRHGAAVGDHPQDVPCPSCTRRAEVCDCVRAASDVAGHLVIGLMPCNGRRRGDVLCPASCACGGRGFVTCSTCGGSGALVR